MLSHTESRYDKQTNIREAKHANNIFLLRGLTL